ncbi:MAG: DUF459 domain-containing protein [Kiritimatiellia bacterium]|nr:DUF459 domain-containing protein [Kiritimatiellia bacterium]
MNKNDRLPRSPRAIRRPWGSTCVRRIRRAVVLALIPFAVEAGEPEPIGILWAGDSLMVQLSKAADRALGSSREFRTASLLSIGTGLARPDVFDWNAELSRAVDRQRPSQVVLLLGANDHQSLRAGSDVLRTGTEAWTREYRRRVSSILEYLQSLSITQVYWIGLPPMRDAELNRHIDTVNEIVRSVCLENRQATYIDSAEVLSIRPGRFSAFILKPDDALPLTVRSGDGIHLNDVGGNLLLNRILDKIREDLKAKSGRTPTPSNEP